MITDPPLLARQLREIANELDPEPPRGPYVPQAETVEILKNIIAAKGPTEVVHALIQALGSR